MNVLTSRVIDVCISVQHMYVMLSIVGLKLSCGNSTWLESLSTPPMLS